MKKLSKILIALFAILVLAGCSTEKNTAWTRFFHGMTLKYNIYFNGNESYKKGINKTYSQNTDNYALILPVFVDSKEENASSVSGEMDKAIQKCARGIKFHSITKKPKPSGKSTPQEKEFMAQNEFNKWVDDCYLLMGKAYFMKRDFTEARQHLEYTARQYPNSDVQPIANMYLVRTFCEDNKFKEAKETIDKIEADKRVDKKQIGFYQAIYADYFMKQKDYEDAIPKLNAAIENSKKKRDRLRYTYILGQIYEKQGNTKKAYENYNIASKHNSNYQMEFNSKISMARCYTSKGSNKEIFKVLNKMLKDDKNIEYKDQIYFAMAEVECKIGQEKQAMEHYKLSSATSVSNDYQKAISCLKLGEMYFTKLDYSNSFNYYDTCIQFLPQTYDGYDTISQKAQNLAELVTYTKTIEFEDSVQKIAKMSDKERNKLIDDLIQKVIEQERLEREMEQENNINAYLFDQKRGESTTGGEAGKWYFYNPTQLSYGKNEFQKKWGNRKNEDHWRRKNKTVVLFDEFADGEESDSTLTANTKPRIEDPKSREYYLQDIPLTDSAMAESHKRIEYAIFNASRIYKDRFGDYVRSINSYEDLNKRYPNTDYLLLSYYNLYVLNKLIKNEPEANRYKNLIITKFGNTNYAKLLQNPNFVEEQNAIKRQNEQQYADTYDAFMAGNWNYVKTSANNFINGNPENELVPNFDFLKTMCTAQSGDTAILKRDLLGFIEKYPEHELTEAAEKILSYFGTADLDALIADLKARPDVEKTNSLDEKFNNLIIEEKPEANYEYDENAEHYYVVYFKTDQVDDKRLAFEIRNFNIFNFNMRTFNVVTTPFNSNYTTITVRPFKNKRQSVNYSKMIANSEDVFNKLKNVDYKIFVISSDNFKQLQASKNVDKYIEFYQSNYQQQ